MRRYIRAALLPVCFFALIAPIAKGQQRLDPRQMYERLMCVVPMNAGRGTFDDPKRPMHTPAPSALRAVAASRTGILGYSYAMSDDGLLALVEFVGRDRSAFQQILADSTIKCFLKGRDKREDVEAEFKKHKKDFDFTKFGTRMQ